MNRCPAPTHYPSRGVGVGQPGGSLVQRVTLVPGCLTPVYPTTPWRPITGARQVGDQIMVK
ncbi:MAG: hypothetical protein KA338_11330 [Chloroflexi bacterium]|nr:hypothetical protein [Chloroflexota bacterium]